MQWARPTERPWPTRDRSPPWSWSKTSSTNAGRSRSKPKRLLLRLRPLARLDVALQRFHVLVNPGRVLRPQEPAGETKQPAELVVHLVGQSGRTVLAPGVDIGPGPLERPLDEPAGASRRLVVDVLLHLEPHLVSTGEVQQVAVPCAFARRPVVELLHLLEVGGPLRHSRFHRSGFSPSARAATTSTGW